MRTWGDEIQLALNRARSPYTVEDVLRWLREGSATMGICGNLTASLWFRDGGAEIAHVAGRWDDGDARWLLSWAKREAAARGYSTVIVDGRHGWARFLKRKGLM